ncbi:MAG TPA: alpha/beta hydrolase family protein [Bryobacteraceae bacterium]|nr:alpha/beta hydrolase family protein [Bryobacteraceae bacterium]
MLAKWTVLPLAAAGLLAQVPENWFSEPMLPEQMRQSEMYGFVNANIPALPTFNSLEEWKTYKAQIRSRILRLLGIDDVLARHSLRVIHRNTLQRDGYHIERIAYESYPDMWVPALVYVPDARRGRASAMISISGHNFCDSKASPEVQAMNYNLVRRGFIVMAYDYFACFERVAYDACKPGRNSWDHLNSLFSYTGRTATGIEVLDGIRALDYLHSRPDVDRTRIGFTGASGGGNNTYWVSALDDRVTLSVPVSSATTYDWWIRADLAWDHHQRPPGIRKVADIGTLYALIAPRPLLIINGQPEMYSFALPAALHSYKYARAIYQLYGAKDRIAFSQGTSGHGFQPDKRLLLYRWLNRWFFAGRMPHPFDDLSGPRESKDELRVGLPDGNLTVPALFRRWLAETAQPWPLPATALQAERWQISKRHALESLLDRRTPLEAPSVIFRLNDDLKSGFYKAERFQFQVAPDLLIPGIFIRKEGQEKYKTIIVLEKKRGASPECRELIERGYAVLALDLRGTGEMQWGGTRTSNWSQLVGRPPMGMWSEEISKVTSWLLARNDVASVGILGYDLFGKIALYAAALDPRIRVAAVSTDTLSYRQEADSGLEHLYAEVPRILTWGDTAQLAALVAPRPLLIISAGVPVSLNNELPAVFLTLPRFTPSEKRVPDSELETNYEWTRLLYGLFGSESQFATGSNHADPARTVVEWFHAHH